MRSLSFFFQAEDGIRDYKVTGVQTCALPIYPHGRQRTRRLPAARHHARTPRPAFLYDRHLRPLRLRQFQFHRDSDRRYRRVGSRAARPTREVRHPRHARRYHGQSHVRVHRGHAALNGKREHIAVIAKSKANSEFSRAERATKFILAKTKLRPEIALVLGSGLGAFADEFGRAVKIPYAKIPNFPRSTAIGHAGQLVLGAVDGVAVAAMQGRVHLYEGYSVKDVAFPIRVFARMGVKAVILTNAAGGINREYSPGCLVVVRGHINLPGVNPLARPDH